MKLIIAGGRDFNDYQLLRNETIDFIGKNIDMIDIFEIVSGGANGADKLGEKLCAELQWDLKVFPADWDNYGKSAGPIRNKQMAEYADACICFWDGKSKGTKNMIDNANEKGLILKVVNY